MKPNTFIIGAPKCGTTSLVDYLASHNSTLFSQPKEPLFWCEDLGREPHALRTETLEEYEALFAVQRNDAVLIVGEGTTAYLRSKVAVKRILEYQPQAKFIVILRNPIDVAHAFHMEQRYTGLEIIPDFRDAWEKQNEREIAWDNDRSDAPDSLLYRRIASFEPQILRLFSAVPSSQRLILLFEDLKSSPDVVYRTALDFLGLEDDGKTDFSISNSAHAQRFPALSKFLLAPPQAIRPFVKKFRMKLVSSQNIFVKGMKGLMNVEKPRDALPDDLRREMLEFYLPQIEALEKILDADLSSWKSTVTE